MKNKIIAIIALVAVIGFSMVACSRSDKGGGSGGGSAGKAAPSSDFSYDMTVDGRGIKITGYTGNGGAVVIPATIENLPVLEIGERAFAGSSSQSRPVDAIISIVVPNSVEVIGQGVFSNMDNLTRATLPNGLKVIPGWLFHRSAKLTSVNLPSDLEEIHAQAFVYCSELSDLKIPDSLNSVKFIPPDAFGTPNLAFAGCGKLPIATRQRLQQLGYADNFQ